jgi:Ca2+-binding RTX toxin-like protein
VAIKIGTGQDDDLRGTVGNDTIKGLGGNDTLFGGGGRDLLYGGSGNDTFRYDLASDAVSGEILRGGDGVDTLLAYNSDRFISYTLDLTRTQLDSIEAIKPGQGPVQFNVTAAQVAAVETFSGGFLVFGTGALSLAGKYLVGAYFGLGEGMTDLDASKARLGDERPLGLALSGNDSANRVTATGRDDWLYGNGGNDRLVGLGGDDHLMGGAGNDRLEGGSGNDTLTGGDGVDILLGGRGDDMLVLAAENDPTRNTYDGGAGTDELKIGEDFRDVDLSGQILRGIEIIRSDYATIRMTAAQIAQTSLLQGHFAVAGSGLVTLANTELYDFIIDLSDAGNTLDASSLNSSYFTINGGLGKDTVLGGSSIDIMLGGGGDDTLHGNAGGDQISGNDGNDLLVGGEGDDQLLGGAGNDQLDGGAGNDVLFGGAGKDSVRGGAGDDRLAIETQADVTSGDTYDGGEGMDTLLIAGNDDIDIRTLTTTSIEALDSAQLVQIRATNAQLGSFAKLGAAHYMLTEGGTITFKGDVAAGTFFGAIFTLSDLGNTLDFRAATLDKVAINGGAGNDTVWASKGADTMGLLGGNDTAYGLGGNDLINGGDGTDKLDGGDGNDVLIGGDGADTLIGGAGKDVLGGGPGADVLTGGTGADQFLVSSPDLSASHTATDRITDFNHSEGDIIDLSLIDADTAAFGDQAFVLKSGAFTAAGQLRIVQEGGNTFVEMNTNADMTADLVIRLDGLHTLVAGDLVL